MKVLAQEKRVYLTEVCRTAYPSENFKLMQISPQLIMDIDRVVPAQIRLSQVNTFKTF